MAKGRGTKKEISSVEVMSAVATVINFMKEQTVSDLVEASGSGKIKLEKDELKKVCFYIEASIDKSFMKSSGQIEAKLR